MKLDRIKARNMYPEKTKERYKAKYKKYGKNITFLALRKEFPTNKIDEMTILEYLEMIEKEIEQNKNNKI